jgi:hypothetical protein
MIARFVCLTLFGFGAAQGGDWKTFSPKEGGFTVLMPAIPVEDKQDVMTPSGNVTVTLHFHEVKNEGSLVVSVSDLPAAAFKAGTDESRLDNAREHAIQGAKGRLKSEKRITSAGFPGRDLMIESDAKGGAAVRTRIFAVKQHQVIAVGSKTFVSGKDADRFLNSFKLMK